jgi:hypothetical protein
MHISQLNHEFCKLVDESPAIKYRLDLSEAGLEEWVVYDAMSIPERRQKLETYCSRWEGFGDAKRIPLRPPPFDACEVYVEKGLLVCVGGAGDDKGKMCFVRLPSPTMEIQRSEWIIRGLPGDPVGERSRAIYPPADLLAIPVLSAGG